MGGPQGGVLPYLGLVWNPHYPNDYRGLYHFTRKLILLLILIIKSFVRPNQLENLSDTVKYFFDFNSPLQIGIKMSIFSRLEMVREDFNFSAIVVHLF